MRKGWPRISRKLFVAFRNVIIILLVLSLLGALVLYVEATFESPRQAADRIRDFGVLGPLAVVGLITLEVIVAPVPGTFIAIASGYAFGAVFGTLYAYLGNVIGTGIAFYLARRFGRPLVEHLVSKRNLDIYDSFFNGTGRLMLWIAYVFPIFPSDIISFGTGLGNIKWKHFMFIVVVAYLPNMFLLSYFGATLYESGLSMETLIIGSVLLSVLLFGSLLYFYLRRKANAK